MFDIETGMVVRLPIDDWDDRVINIDDIGENEDIDFVDMMKMLRGIRWIVYPW